MSSEPLILAENVGRHFRDVVAVDDISLEVERGTILGVIGPSGSGKTTLIRMLTGTLQPSSGRLCVLGEDPGAFRKRTRERIGYMPQHFVLYPDLTAEENVSFMAALFGLLWRQRWKRVREVLQTVELWDARKRRARQLSGGMQRRLALACALVHKPELLFVDEPTAGLDPILRQKIWDELRRLRSEGATMLVTTQYVGEAEYCDKVALLAEGQLVALDTPEHLRQAALGGEVIEVETAGVVDGSSLERLPGVIRVRQTGPRKLLVVADDAGSATPRVLQAISSQGVEAVEASEYRPSFDEVFAELLSRWREGEGREPMVQAA